MQKKIVISLVTYNPLQNLLEKTLSDLVDAIKALKVHFGYNAVVIIVDNSPTLTFSLENVVGSVLLDIDFVFIKNPKNMGFGEGHNKAIAFFKDSDYHLVLNPDIEFKRDAISNAICFMEKNKCCGLLTPYATWPDGSIQRLCKKKPTFFDLFLRGFAPDFVKYIFHARLSKYEMSEYLTAEDIFWNPPIVSGCFMLFRTEILQRLGGFNPRFFLYFEDFDISLRAGKISRIAYVPQVKVVHHGGHASRKGWRHIWMFGRSMVTFFNIHGWRWW